MSGASLLLLVLLTIPVVAYGWSGVTQRSLVRIAGICAAGLIVWLLARSAWRAPRDNLAAMPLLYWTGSCVLVAAILLALRYRRLTGALLPLYAAVAMGIVSIYDFDRLAVRLWTLLFFVSAITNVARFAKAPRPIRWQSVLWLTVWFGLATSLLENAWRAVRICFYNEMLFLNVADIFAYLKPEAHWMVPLANLTAFGTIGLALGVLAWRRPAALPAQGVIFGLALLCGHCLARQVFILLPECVPLLGGWVVAVGLTREIATRPEVWLRFMRRSVPVFAVVLALLAVVFPAHEANQLRQVKASLPAPSPAVKNVLLITLDTLRPQNLSLCGYERPTSPRLEELARRGVLFERAIAPAPWTLPTHASLMTGLLPTVHGADFIVPLSQQFTTLAEVFSQAGYDTVGVVSNFDMCGAHTGLDQGFQEYFDRPINRQLFQSASLPLIYLSGVFPLDDLRPNAEAICNRFTDWLDRRDGARPYFAFLNLYDPHGPYMVPDPKFDKFSNLPPEALLRNRTRWLISCEGEGMIARNDPQETQAAIDTYDGCIAYLDHHLGRLIDGLEERGLLENTVVLITNDHGEHFGEHAVFGHGMSLYRQEIESPLLMLAPQLQDVPRRLSQPVSLTRAPATLVDLAGLPSSRAIVGESLRAMWESPEQMAPPAYSRLEPPFNRPGPGGIDSVIADGKHYVRYPEIDREELYDFEEDPLERVNLADTPDGRNLLPRFRELAQQMPRGSVETAAASTPREPALAQWFLPPRLCCGRCGYRSPLLSWHGFGRNSNCEH